MLYGLESSSRFDTEAPGELACWKEVVCLRREKSRIVIDLVERNRFLPVYSFLPAICYNWSLGLKIIPYTRET